MLIEKVTGRPWGTDLEERFTKPLGLSDTRNCMVTPLVPRRARGYEPDGNSWRNAPFLAMSQPYAAGAICSTVGDIAKWNRALHTGKVVSPASYALMTTPEGAAVERRYGFGLGRDTVGGRTAIAHNGGIHGFVTENVWVPSAELSVTVLTNSGAAPADRLRRQLALAALGVPLEVPPKVVPLTAADRARYVGVYALALPGGTRDFTVAELGDQLTGQLEGQGANPMLHFGAHTFGASFDPALRIIFVVEGQRATKMALLQGGGRFEGVRK
jgi:CubicO group peptidase (beta-lactamase class C family)